MLDYRYAAEQLDEAFSSIDQAVDNLDDAEALRLRAVKLRNDVEKLSQDCAALVVDEDEEKEEVEDEEEAGD